MSLSKKEETLAVKTKMKTKVPRTKDCECLGDIPGWSDEDRMRDEYRAPMSPGVVIKDFPEKETT